MTEMKGLLDEAVGSYRPASDQEAVEGRARRRQRTRRATAAVLALAIVAVPGWLAWSVSRPDQRIATDTTASTYVLENFEVTASVDPTTGETSATEVMVMFDVRWSDQTFPGVHHCSVRIRDASGTEIGSIPFENESLTERTRATLEAIPVTGPIGGAIADGSCSDERLDTPVAYEISDVTFTVNDGEVTVTYLVGWPDTLGEGEYPGTNACTAAVWDGGTVLVARRLTLGAPEGPQEETFARPPGGSPTAATVMCAPFVGEGVFPEPLAPPDGRPSPATVAYEDPLGWTAQVPEDWHVLRFDGFNGRSSVRGAAFSTVLLRPAPDDTYPDLSELFPDGAALIVSHTEGGPAPELLTDDSSFPLRWEDFEAIPGGLVVGQTQAFRAAGMAFQLDVAVRADAPVDLVRTLQAIVASIEPAALTQGERLPSGYVPLSASLVEVEGSGSVVDVGSRPFMLVHAPGGYYALGLPSEVSPSSVFSWDFATQEVVWTQDSVVFARYDRAGTPVLTPPGADLALLEIHPVVRAWDGVHLLLHPDSSYAPLPPGMWQQGG